MSPARPRLLGSGVVDQELTSRAWRGAVFGATGLAVVELAYVFIDYRVFGGALLLPVLRALHVLWVLVLLALLLTRRQHFTLERVEAVFAAGVLPFLPLFALAERAMALAGNPWIPMTGHRLVMLALGVLAPTRLWVGGGLIIAFALEAVVLWFGLDLDQRLPDVAWEPWVTLVYGGVALTMLAYRVRSQNIELRLREARAEAEALERLARLFLAVRDATNTPLQTLELGLTVLRQRCPERVSSLAPMERAVQRLRSLTQRLGGVDPLVVWREGDESFDAEAILRHLEEDLARELERRRH
jgi:hypothetical protein